MTMSRSDNSPVARWWWTLDRISLFCIFGLITVGIFLAFAASPAATGHAHAAGNFSYALKQLAFSATAVGILVTVSVLNSRQARIVAATVYRARVDRCVVGIDRRRGRQRRASLAGIRRFQDRTLGIPQARFRNSRCDISRRQTEARFCR